MADDYVSAVLDIPVEFATALKVGASELGELWSLASMP